MKSAKLSLLLLLAALIAVILCVTACSQNENSGDVTTEPTTESPSEPRPTLDIPEDAAAVDALIASIDGATVENTEKIDLAYLGYWTLSETERAKVTGYETLQTLRSELTKAYVVKEYKDDRIPHNEIIIGGYGIAYSSDAALQALVDCGFDFVWNGAHLSDRASLDRYQQYGLGIFMNGTLTGLPVSYTISEEEFRAGMANMYPDHEAVWLIDHTDEPQHNDMINLWRTGKIIYEECFPHSAYIQNLVPVYANGDHVNPERLYSWTYTNTVATFTDIICFDHYLYAPENDGGLHGANRLTCWLDELDILSNWCVRYDKDLYAIIQNTDVWHYDDPQYPVTTDMMKFQAYTAMAYGAKALAWFHTGHPKDFITDADGNRNEMYDMLKETHDGVLAMEPMYMRYTYKSHVLLYDEKSPISQTMEVYQGNKDPEAMEQSSLANFTVSQKSAALIGAFDKNVGDGEAFLLVGCNNYRFHNNKKQEVTVTFTATDPSSILTAYVNGIPTVLEPDENGVYTVNVIDADAVFITVD